MKNEESRIIEQLQRQETQIEAGKGLLEVIFKGKEHGITNRSAGLGKSIQQLKKNLWCIKKKNQFKS